MTRALTTIAAGAVGGIALSSLLTWMFLWGCPLVDRDFGSDFS
ncbi:hypothetical protein [Mycobacterium dioxanotrophicus]|nr:hypothetical protein [Mycobacterium dioxanotrophicus]